MWAEHEQGPGRGEVVARSGVRAPRRSCTRARGAPRSRRGSPGRAARPPRRELPTGAATNPSSTPIMRREADRVARVAHGVRRLVEDRVEPEKAVDHARILSERHRHAGRLELRRVQLRLEVEGIAFRRHDERGRQAGVVRSEERRDPPVVRHGRRGKVVGLVPQQLVPVEEVALVRHVEAAGEVASRHRVDEQLEADAPRTPRSRASRDDRREVAAGAVAGDGEPGRVAPERVGVLAEPGGGRVRVHDRRRETCAPAPGGTRRETTRPRRRWRAPGTRCRRRPTDPSSQPPPW